MTRPRLAFALAALALIGLTGWDDEGSVYVRFAGPDDIPGAIEYALNGAHKSVRVMAYSFTDGQIADALIRAKARGVDVKVLIDDQRVKESQSVIPMLLKAGIPVFADAMHKLFHHKVIVIDGHRTLGGSFNFSTQAKRNAENSTDIVSAPFAAAFVREWDRHRAHAEDAGSNP